MATMRRCYIISYDVRVGGDYDSRIEAIKQYRTWAHITQSTWAIVSDESPTQIRDKLTAHMASEDRLFVVRSGVEAAWRNVLCKHEWLKKHL